MFSCSAYATPDELVTRLRRSVIMHNNKPVYVEGVEGMNLILAPILGGESFAVSSSDEGISIESPPLGYVNTEDGAVYSMRRPLRLYKQGLCYDNITTTGGGFNDRFLRSKGFCNMLLGNYPPLSSCIGGVAYTNPFSKQKASLKAFHRYLAADGKDLYHKGKKVGLINEDKTFTLYTKYAYLGEEIEEILNEC